MCHNSKMAQNGVRLDDGAAALAGGYSGPVIVPGKSADSKLFQRVSSSKKGFQMPPAGAPLTEAEVAAVKAWIDAGAVWPRTAQAATAARPRHWSYQPIAHPAPPAVSQKEWVRNPIDNFVLARLEKENVPPSPEASKTALLRRVSLDLTGLPPTPEETKEFLEDNRPDAYERQVDRLLASPHYGEQRAGHWLDLARYADSDGYEKDVVRPYAWRWRNYVIDSFNRDKPFDQFTVEQLAGDLLPNATLDQMVATGFQRNALTNREGGVDRKENRFDQLINRTNTASTVWLGLTMGCAQCHDHKYDAISQKEYYSMLAFFNKSDERDINAPMPGEMGPWMRARPEYLEEVASLKKLYDVDELQTEWENSMRAAMDHPGENLEWDFQLSAVITMFDRFQEILKTPPDKRDPRDADAVFHWFIRNVGPMEGRDRDRLLGIRQLAGRIARLDAKQPKLTQANIMVELPQTDAAHVAIKGDYRSPGVEVQPTTLAVLPPLPADAPRNRLTLARWLVSSDNPLTARVTVNRLWQDLFGRGLVKSSDDFGTQGERPSHPELLDWLASDFRDHGWSVKRTIRTIVTSATYRQSSHARPELTDKDPDNVLLARQSRVRLEAESIRDSALAASGLLNPDIGGPSVHPPQPKGVAELGYANSVKWVNDEGPSRYRRGLYIHFQRTTPYPMLMNFDRPDSNVACSRRNISNSPLQALNLMNDPVFYEAAQALALRVNQEAQPGHRIDYLFELTLGRDPSARERQRVKTLVDQQATAAAQNAAQAKALLPLQPQSAGWTTAARALLNLEEFITRE